MAAFKNVKTKIKEKLDALKTAGTLGAVVVDDFRLDPLGLMKDLPAYPAAILGPGSTESVAETNRENLRTHVFEIVVVLKGENVTGPYVVEDLAEAILDAFDNDVTLGSVAVGGVDPATSPVEAISTPEQTFIVFSVTIRAKVLFTQT